MISPCGAGQEEVAGARASSVTEALASDYTNLVCAECAAGKFQPEANQDSCNSCARGYHQPRTGQTTCDPCPVGTFQNLEGQAGCAICEPGTYQPFPAQDRQTSCLVCAQGKQQPSAGQTECEQCPPGSFSGAGSPRCTPCFKGTYASEDATECFECPEGATTAQVGSLSIEDCVCGQGFYNNMTDGVNCLECPVGTICAPGTTLTNLVLQKGYYRPSNTSIDVQRCPDAAFNGTGCIGGSGSPCAAGLKGAFCELCVVEGSNFYSEATSISPASCKACANAASGSMLMFLVALVVAAAVALLYRSIPAERLERARTITKWLSPQNKLKIVVGSYMIATKVPSVYEVPIPEDVRELLKEMSKVITLGIQGFTSAPLECAGLRGYVPRLLFWMIWPFAAVLILIIAASILHARKPGKQSTALLEQVLPWALRLLFLVYPVVTNISFEAFPCHVFEGFGDGWLVADVDIECGSKEHARAISIAWLALILYPFGLLGLNFALLMKARPSILVAVDDNQRPTPFERRLAASTIFLHGEYQPRFFWWELAEMARRLFLIGIMVVIEPGKMTQIAIGTIFSAAFLVVQLIAQPFKKGSDDLLGVSCSFALLMFFVCSVLYKIDALTSIDDLQAKMSLEQKRIYALSPLTLSYILIGSVLMSIIAMALIVSGQIALEARRRMKLRRIKYLKTGKEVELTPLEDAQAFHLFLSHAWPAAQDRMRIVKERFTEAMPSARVFLDVDNLKSGSGTAEVDKSECILVFCTKACRRRIV